jgi:hypothetical protein
MGDAEQLIGEHDVVSLLCAHGRWPKGYVGTVVNDYGDVKLIEIADDKGQMLDLFQVPEDQLRLVVKCRS